MNILNKLAIKNLKLNKKRTTSTIIGIILSCALICAVATMVTSFQATLVENAVNETGYYHLKIYNIKDEDIKSLKVNRDIEQVLTVNENGYGILQNSQNEYKPYLKLYSMDQTMFENLKFNLIEGTFPKNSNEVIISKHIIDNAKVDYKIGDKIKVNIGKRKTLDGYDLGDSNLYNKEDEEIIEKAEFEFTIVGIIERPDYSFEKRSDPGYTIISTNIDSKDREVYITLKEPKEYKTAIASIMGVKDYKKVENYTPNIQDLKYKYFSINQELLRWEVMAFSDNTVQMLYAVAGVVIFIIIFTSVFCIRNSFAIAITEKLKMYGMLSSIGATKKQIKKNVIFESLILGVIGIPLGILSGVFAVYVLLQIVNSLLGDYLLNHVDGITMNISILSILITIILGIITIYLSAISSAKKASKVSPVDLIRNSQDIKIKGKKLKTPKIISKLFKTGGVLACKNLKRSKKKYRTTVISLAVSISIFIAMNSFITNMFGLTGNYYEDYDYNVLVYLRNEKKDTVEKLKKLENIDEYFILYSTENEYSLKVSDISKFNNEEQVINDSDESKKYLPLQIKALDDNTFKKYAKKIGVNYEKVKDKGILCDKYFNYVDGKQVEKRIYKFAAGDTIKGILNNEEKSFEIGAVTDTKPYGIENSYTNGGYLIIDLDTHKSMHFEPTYMSIQSNNTENLIEEMQSKNIDVGYANFEESAKEQKAMVLVIKIFLYGFIAVITLIGVTNIFNTITSNIELRQKEFAMLKSIGMTKKEFNGMINLETIFYSTKSLIYGISLGFLGTFAMYKAFSVKIEREMYIPIMPTLISIVAVFILVFIIMKYSVNKVNKQNTIETIRNNNI